MNKKVVALPVISPERQLTAALSQLTSIVDAWKTVYTEQKKTRTYAGMSEEDLIRVFRDVLEPLLESGTLVQTVTQGSYPPVIENAQTPTSTLDVVFKYKGKELISIQRCVYGHFRIVGYIVTIRSV